MNDAFASLAVELGWDRYSTIDAALNAVAKALDRALAVPDSVTTRRRTSGFRVRVGSKQAQQTPLRTNQSTKKDLAATLTPISQHVASRAGSAPDGTGTQKKPCHQQQQMGEPCFTTPKRTDSKENRGNSVSSQSSFEYPSPSDTPPRQPSKTPVPLTPKCKQTPRSVKTARQFARQRESLARALFQKYNETVFGNALPQDMVITWSKRLNTTAGRAILQRKGQVRLAHIELSTKVVDAMERLENTLCHELCHAAAWLIHGVAKPPHGAVFQGLAAKAMRHYPHLSIKTCHSYEINYKHQYQCQTAWCLQIYGRHSKSINVKTQRCGKCHGELKLLPKLKADGTPRKKVVPKHGFKKKTAIQAQ
eukprot:m.203698 g.203698  ORF g.203698 m.203698 type:complete len:364 (-) comp14993_c0_seq2:905-1996(-)